MVCDPDSIFAFGCLIWDKVDWCDPRYLFTMTACMIYKKKQFFTHTHTHNLTCLFVIFRGTIFFSNSNDTITEVRSYINDKVTAQQTQ